MHSDWLVDLGRKIRWSQVIFILPVRQRALRARHYNPGVPLATRSRWERVPGRAHTSTDAPCPVCDCDYTETETIMV